MNTIRECSDKTVDANIKLEKFLQLLKLFRNCSTEQTENDANNARSVISPSSSGEYPTIGLST